MTINDLRRTIQEQVPHLLSCVHAACKPVQCSEFCPRYKLLTALDAAEKHLREMVLQPLEHAWDSDSLLVAERLAAFLNADETGPPAA